jgi:hypothetical protein
VKKIEMLTGIIGYETLPPFPDQCVSASTIGERGSLGQGCAGVCAFCEFYLFRDPFKLGNLKRRMVQIRGIQTFFFSSRRRDSYPWAL